MSLQKTIVSIPIAEGLDTKTDDKLVAAGKALVLENARFQKTGRLSKRFGLTPLQTTTNLGSLNAPSLVLTTNKGIGVADGQRFFVLDQSSNIWQNTSFYPASVGIQTNFINKIIANHESLDVYIDTELNRTIYAYNAEFSPTFTAPVIGYIDNSTGFQDGKSPPVTSTQLILTRVSGIRAGGASYYMLLAKETFNVGWVAYIYDQNLNLITGITGTTPSADVGQIEIVSDGVNFFVFAQNGTTLAIYKIDSTGAIVSSAVSVQPTLSVTAGTPFAGSSAFIQGNNIFYCWGSPTTVELIAFNKLTLAQSIPVTSIAYSGKRIGIVADGSNVYLTASFLSNVGYNYAQSYAARIPYITTFGTPASYNLLGFPDFGGVSVLSYPFIKDSVVYGVFQSDYTDNNTGYVVDLSSNAVISTVSSGQLRPTSAKIDYHSCRTQALNDNVYTLIEKQFRSVASGFGADITASFSTALVNLDFINNWQKGTRSTVGESTYCANGKVLAFDGTKLYESGFDFIPKIYNGTLSTGSGSIPDGVYNYVLVYNYYNTNGEIERSAPSLAFPVTVTGGPKNVIITASTIPFTLKKFAFLKGTDRAPVAALYRTQAAGTVFFKVAELSFAEEGQPITLVDTLTDIAIADNEVLYTAGGVLVSDPTPQARFSTSGGNRLFLGGLEEKDEIAFSKKQLFDEGVSFSDFFRIRISSASNADKSDISALGYLDGKLIVFREQSIYFISGDGPLETGQQDTFTEPQVISTDAGCIEPRSVLNVPFGVMFKSNKGIYLLDRSLSTQYIGAPVEDFNSEKIVSSILSEKFNEARFYTENGKCLVYNFVFNSWAVFKDQSSLDADSWIGSPVSLIGNKVYKETENTFTDDSDYYSMRLVTPWLKLQAVQDFQRIYRLWIIGNYKSAHTLKLKIYVNYNETEVETYDLVYNPEEVQYQFRVSMPFQKVESIKFELYDTDQDDSGESFDLTNLQAEVGLKQGGYKIAATKSF